MPLYVVLHIADALLLYFPLPQLLFGFRFGALMVAVVWTLVTGARVGLTE